VKDENGIIDRIGGIVWLKPLDQVAHYSISDSLYFSFVQGDTISIDWPSFKNWEFDSPKIDPACKPPSKTPRRHDPSTSAGGAQFHQQAR